MFEMFKIAVCRLKIAAILLFLYIFVYIYIYIYNCTYYVQVTTRVDGFSLFSKGYKVNANLTLISTIKLKNCI